MSPGRGAERIRTVDPLPAEQVLYQLSYSPSYDARFYQRMAGVRRLTTALAQAHAAAVMSPA
jgi:hypothetical protein